MLIKFVCFIDIKGDKLNFGDIAKKILKNKIKLFFSSIMLINNNQKMLIN